MLIILLPISAFLLWSVLYEKERGHGDTVAMTAAVWCTFLWGMTEVLSTFKCLTLLGSVVGWAFFCAVQIVILWVKRRCGMAQKDGSLFQDDKIFRLLFIICIGGMFIISVFVVPNNSDSMSYHLPRVMHWVQNQSVSYYDTYVNRQNFSPVFAEYIVLHVFLLSGCRDWWVNLPQWAGYVLCMMECYFITKELGLHKRLSGLSAVLFAALPIAIAEATTTQVDLVASAIFMLFTYCVLKLWKRNNLQWKAQDISMACLCASTVGLGYLTKSSVCFPMLILLLGLAIRRIRYKDDMRLLLSFVGMGAAIVLVFCLPTFTRNTARYGDIFASDYMSRIAVGTGDVRLLVMNSYKNFALLIANPYIKKYLVAFGKGLAGVLRVDLDNPSITFGHDFSVDMLPTNHHHDTANISAMTLFLIVVFVIWLLQKLCRKAYNQGYRIFILCMEMAFASMLMIVRFQIWAVRLLLPVVVFFPILFCYYLSEIRLGLNVKRVIAVSAACACVFSAILTVLTQGRPRLSYFLDSSVRFKRYFINQNELYNPYDEICQYLVEQGYKNIGLVNPMQEYEYPFWPGSGNARIENVFFEAEAGNPFEPDCIVFLRTKPEEVILYHGIAYECALEVSDNIFVYVK